MYKIYLYIFYICMMYNIFMYLCMKIISIVYRFSNCPGSQDMPADTKYEVFLFHRVCLETTFGYRETIKYPGRKFIVLL